MDGSPMEITTSVGATPSTPTSTIPATAISIVPATTIGTISSTTIGSTPGLNTGTIPGTTAVTNSVSTVSAVQGTTTSSVSTTAKTTISGSIAEDIPGTSFYPSPSTDAQSTTSINSQPMSTSTTTTISPVTKTNLTMTGGKRKQKMRWRDVNAPKAPLTAYLQFLSKTRDALRAENPGMSTGDITKFLGTMWTEMPLDKKQIYLDQAEKEKRKYMVELEQYHKSDSYKSFIEQREKTLKTLKQEEKASPGSHLICIPCNKWFESTHNFREHVKSRKHQRNILENQTSGKNSKKPAVTDKQDDRFVETVTQKKTTMQGLLDSKTTTQMSNFPDMSKVAEGDLKVPVFSDAFLHYNKGRESELRKLRKSTMELEEQNAILSKHIDSLNSAISKFEDDKTQSEQDIKILEPFLESFHEFLSRRLSKSRILDTNTQLKETNIKELLDKLSTSCDETMMLKLKRVLNELDYPHCLNHTSSS